MGVSETENGRPEHPLKAARVAAGLTQIELGDKAGLRNSLISMAESGYIPSADSRQAIAGALGVSPVSIWGT